MESAALEKGGHSTGLLGVRLFILTEAILFAALFSVYFFIRRANVVWTHPSGGALEILPLPLALTVVLLSSSATMQWAVSATRRGDRGGLLAGLSLTVLLGILFLVGQGREFAALGFTPQSGPYGATFFLLTGFHGAHVLGGIIFLSLLLFRAALGQFGQTHHLAVEAGSLYWHFVDVVWVGLFTTLYLLQR